MDDEDLIQQYIVGEKGYEGIPAEMLFDKITKYKDIRDEFVRWLKERNYDVDDPVVVEGYNALAILDVNPKMDGIGVYNVLVDLRDHPEEMMRMIREGLCE